MGLIFKGSVYGVLLIVVLSAVMSPFICISVSSRVDVVCDFAYSSEVFLNIYANPYSPILLLLGAVVGGLVGRAIALVKSKGDILDRQEYLKTKNKKFLWMWER